MTYNLKTTLYFFRHGETFYNAEGRIQGQLDTPLSPVGREQALEVGRLLKLKLQTDGVPPESPGWFASPLSRASETMALARKEAGLPDEPFARDTRLMELNFGLWQDQTWPDIKTRDPAAVAARKADFWNFRPPEGESYADLADRVRAFLDGLTGPAVVAAHGGVARALMVLIGGLQPHETRGMPVYQGRILVFSAGRGHWI